MRERDLEEFLAVSYEKDKDELARSLAQRYGDLPFAFCFGIDDKPVAIWTGIELHPGVWSIGMWATDDFPKIAKFVTKMCCTHIFSAMLTTGCHRIECKSIIGYDSVHRWLSFCGLRQSKETLQKYGKNGEDFVLFEWVEGMPWMRGYHPSLNDGVAS